MFLVKGMRVLQGECGAGGGCEVCVCDQSEGPLEDSVPLTSLIAIKLRVEVLLRVKRHLDPIGHLQPLVGNRQTQVLGQCSSEAQAGEGTSHSCTASDWALSAVLG